MHSTHGIAVSLRDLVFAYRKTQAVLDIKTFQVMKSEKLFLYGPSGSGKTSLLGILTGILEPTSGKVEILGEQLSSYSGSQRDRFRGDHIGYIFQLFNLIPYLSVKDNIALTCRLNSRRLKRLGGGLKLDEEVGELASTLGLDGLLNRGVNELSVGQQQRVAVARALLGRPELIIADEPTSALDIDQKEKFLDLLFSEVEKLGSTLIFVSHDHSLRSLFSRSLALTEINHASGLAGQD